MVSLSKVTLVSMEEVIKETLPTFQNHTALKNQSILFLVIAFITAILFVSSQSYENSNCH